MTLRTSLLIWAIAACVALAGCASTGTPRRTPAPSAAVSQPSNPQPAVIEPEPAESATAPPAATEPASHALALQPGTGKFINEEIAGRAPPPAGASGEVSFNFEGQSLHAVIKAILGDILHENYVIAPGVQGTVTFSTAKPLRDDQALSVLEMLLRWNNATLVWRDGRYTILPIAQAIPGNLTPRVGPVNATRGYEVRAVPLKYISPTAMEKLLKPYARQDAVVSVDNARNLIVLAGTGAELANYLQTIETFDVDWLAGMSVGIFRLQQAEVAKIVPQLEQIFGASADTPMAGMFRFLPLEGINSVVVITPRAEYLSRAEEWLAKLDMGGNGAGQRLYVHDVKNVKAVDLAETLSQVFGTGGGQQTTRPPSDLIAPGLEPVEVRTLGREGRPELPQTRQNQNAAQKSNQPSNIGGTVNPEGAVVDANGGIALTATDEVRISAVEESNSLLVLASAAQWESIRRVIERLDQIPLQVQIEVQIIQVSLNDALSYGVQWYFENSIPGGLRELARHRNIWGDTAGQFGVLDPKGAVTPLSWTFVGPNMSAVISALDSVSTIKVLSAPSLMVLNNKSASINVGTQLPVVSSFIGTVPGETTTGVSQSYVQFRQTGITLDVTPRVNPGGLVFMEITQTDSTPGSQDAAVGGNVPVDQRTITTEIAVQSGETVLLGGLITQTDDHSQAGVPGLARIPFLGALFGRRNQSTARKELLVVIKPTVIHNTDEARRITEEYRSQFQGLAPLRVKLENMNSKETQQ